MDTKAQDEQMANTVAPQGSKAEPMPKRQKHWGELAIEEKLERMRTLVKSLVLTSGSLRRELADTRSFIWDHAHEENGDVVIKVKKNEAYKLRENNAFNQVEESMLAGVKIPDDQTYF